MPKASRAPLHRCTPPSLNTCRGTGLCRPSTQRAVAILVSPPPPPPPPPPPRARANTCRPYFRFSRCMQSAVPLGTSDRVCKTANQARENVATHPHANMHVPCINACRPSRRTIHRGGVADAADAARVDGGATEYGPCRLFLTMRRYIFLSGYYRSAKRSLAYSSKCSTRCSLIFPPCALTAWCLGNTVLHFATKQPRDGALRLRGCFLFFCFHPKTPLGEGW